MSHIPDQDWYVVAPVALAVGFMVWFLWNLFKQTRS